MVPNLGVLTSGRGHTLNLISQEMVYETGKKKNNVLPIKFMFFSPQNFFAVSSCEILDSLFVLRAPNIQIKQLRGLSLLHTICWSESSATVGL